MTFMRLSCLGYRHAAAGIDAGMYARPKDRSLIPAGRIESHRRRARRSVRAMTPQLTLETGEILQVPAQPGFDNR